MVKPEVIRRRLERFVDYLVILERFRDYDLETFGFAQVRPRRESFGPRSGLPRVMRV